MYGYHVNQIAMNMIVLIHKEMGFSETDRKPVLDEMMRVIRNAADRTTETMVTDILMRVRDKMEDFQNVKLPDNEDLELVK